MKLLRLALTLLLASQSGCQLQRAQTTRTVVQPKDNGRALINPGMGWVFHHYDDNLTTYTVSLAPTDTVPEFLGVSVVYMRLA